MLRKVRDCLSLERKLEKIHKVKMVGLGAFYSLDIILKNNNAIARWVGFPSGTPMLD